MAERRKPGAIRDAILSAFEGPANRNAELTVADIRERVSAKLGEDVPSSSVRSYLNINTPGQFIRTGRGTYRLVRR
ncbi:DNA methylase N-4/N-6 domain-containing protein [Intrasporangium calvum]|uniref:DNA methylase N-4/N-6 domain-containing protein n=1 Tax=Intrasporangium calvum (strain ATCC 23552 / DSM 43043 / JCM 3097 / NBRC 12989 / NCIMB 10167 / NRRL B-3866 / 7 KIP) TaxID=710696 RepID=E6SEK0_INTC7|nr:DNA methylase N-4/N-6 domain-containing protein [Intrasporangium calvum]ADU46601.1 DNA methylase N-4/N-6 domain-containing protein [Intrasporangium calvum DSM 43043]